MADVLAIFGVLLFLGITFPGLLTPWRTLLPGIVNRAKARISYTLWRCFWLGLVLSIFAMVPVVILLALPFGPAKLIGAGFLIFTLGFASFGASGAAAFHAGL